MKAGDTYRVTNPGPGIDENRHLWVILSDPDQHPQEVLAVFMTTADRRRDQTCILEPGDHPAITRKTCIAYGVATVWTKASFLRAIQDDDIRMKEAVSDEVLEKIRKLAAFSPTMMLNHRLIIEKQGLA